MTIQDKKTMTLDEILKADGRKPYLELLHGVVREKRMGNQFHSFLQNELGALLRIWGAGTGGFALTEQRCIFEVGGEEHTLLPGVSWFTHEQLPTLSPAPVRVPPTLAIEILSPDERFSDVQEKLLMYLSAGVSVVWLVDPTARKVSVYRPGREPQLLAAPAQLEDPLLPGLAIPLADLFARLPQVDASQSPV